MPKNEDTNGFIPVKYEYCDAMYDTKTQEYLVIVKIGSKRIVFQQVKD